MSWDFSKRPSCVYTAEAQQLQPLVSGCRKRQQQQFVVNHSGKGEQHTRRVVEAKPLGGSINQVCLLQSWRGSPAIREPPRSARGALMVTFRFPDGLVMQGKISIARSERIARENVQQAESSGILAWRRKLLPWFSTCQSVETRLRLILMNQTSNWCMQSDLWGKRKYKMKCTKRI